MALQHKEPHRNVNFSIPVVLIDRLDAEAYRQERTKTALVRKALLEYLDKAETDVSPHFGGLVNNPSAAS